MRFLIPLLFVTGGVAIFFPMGQQQDSCCCSCGTPQPASCGCQPACPQPPPCPVCPPTPICPTAYCPSVSPVYVCQGASCGGSYGGGGGCSGGDCGGGCSGGNCGGGGGCSGGGCGGGGGGCSGGGCGGGGGGGGYAQPQGYVTGGNGYATGGGGYATGGGGYATGGGGYGQGGGGGYSQGATHVPAAVLPDFNAAPPPPVANEAGSYSRDQPNGGPIPPTAQSAGPAPIDDAPPPNQLFRDSKGQCTPTIKYILLKPKRGNTNGEEDGIELEETFGSVPRNLKHKVFEASTGSPLSSPLSSSEIGDDLTKDIAKAEAEFNDEYEDIDGSRAQASPTLNDAKCNSKILKKLIMRSIVKNDALASKRAIHEMAVKSIPEQNIDVICSESGFTYLVSTIEHCEAQKDNVICFVYKRS